MIENIGTSKAALQPATQTSPTAPAKRPAEVDKARDAEKAPPVEAGRQKQEAQPLDDVVQELNHLVRELHRELHFTVDNESGDTVIKVVDRETDEVVRQIPSEEVVRLRKRLQEAAGVIFRDSA